ncbi:ABC transporter substrate-binding protein [Roseateles sp. PN1]|uniref:ABC transporter substrate-binding protein n=1 Tax=Roseateles sp. PN1 TaxID=3137372 RepID=UPI003138AFF5
MMMNIELSRRQLLLATLMAPTLARAQTVTDLAGRRVDLPRKVERIVLGEGRQLYTLALLEDPPLARVVGWQGDMAAFDPQTYQQYRARFAQIDAIAKIGSTSEASVSPEKVLSLRPDLAIFSLSGHGPGRRHPLVEQLQKSGVPVLFIDFREHPLANTIPSLRLLGQALGREARAEKFIAFYEAQTRRVTELTQGVPINQLPRVLLDARAGDVAGVLTAGRGSLGELIEMAGGINAGADLIASPLGEVSLEAVIAARPEVYIATGYQHPGASAAGLRMGAQVSESMARESLLQVARRRPEIATLPAVRAGRIHGVWHHFYNTPYHVVMLQAMARWLHPQRLAGVDPQATWQLMHREFLGMAPSGQYWISA